MSDTPTPKTPRPKPGGTDKFRYSPGRGARDATGGRFDTKRDQWGQFRKGSGARVVGSAEALARIKSDFDAIIESLKDTRLIESLAMTARNLIQVRTFAGRDIDDQQFRPYSTHWAEIRARKGLPTDRVTLRFAGTSYGAIDRTIESPRHAILLVRPHVGGGNDTPRDEVAETHQRGGRKWFGFSPKDRRVLQREAAAELAEIILARPRFTRTGEDVTLLKNRYQKTVIEGRTAVYHVLAGASRRSP